MIEKSKSKILLEDDKVILPTFEQTGIPKDIQIKLLHTWNEDMYKENIIPEKLYKLVKAKIDRL